MILPSWATHLAIDEDGEVSVFDRAPVFLPQNADWSGMWVLSACLTGYAKVLLPTQSPNLAVYPLEVAQRLCVSLEHLPEWTTHVAFDADGEVCAYDSCPVWSEGNGGMWIVAAVRMRACTLDNVGTLGASVARTLCLAISPPFAESGDV